MSKVQANHHQEWHIRIDREPGDDWPDISVRRSWARADEVEVFRPEQIIWHHRAGDKSPSSAVRGPRLKLDGEPGKRVMSLHSQVPDWAKRLIDDARHEAGFTPVRTGADW